ncbi:MFS transporter [Streptomyces sp. B1I3]|uniref:MFS transporter n=1 Tax=Streptomyces sp. B1I3 TaxID=3042264 RepID=UPI002780E407|nr:MFS transporter [Streptomyces sp. B1I3]MDQ0794217.1 sugar phosphate permease [Streptomyces sp. B1I3]
MSGDVTTAAQRPSVVGANHRWVILGIGVAAQASFSAAISGLPVAGPQLRSAYGLSNFQLGLVIGVIYLGIAASEILWGVWTDRFGERRVLLLGLLSTGAVLALMGVVLVPAHGSVPPLALLVAAMLLVGLFGGSINGSSGRAVMTWFQDGQRGLAMSIRQTAMPAGGAIGIAVLPALASSSGFRPVYLLLAGLCFAAAAATWRWLHEPPETTAPAGAVQVDSRSPLRRGDVWRLALASSLLTVPQFGVVTFLAIYLHDVEHAGVLAAVVAMCIVQFGGGAARIWSGRYTDKRGNRRPMIRIIGVLSAVALGVSALLAQASSPVAVVTLVIGGVFANAWHGVAYTEIASMAGAGRSGTALGLENTMVFAMGFVSPLFIPLLLGWSSWSVVWLFAGVASAVAVPLVPRKEKAI